MDAAGQAINVAGKLAVGDAQTILAFVAVFAVLIFGGGCVWLGRRLFQEMKSCTAQWQSMIERKIESDMKLAAAIEGSNQVNRTALDTLRTFRP